MKILIMCPRAEFDDSLQKRLARLGEVIYTSSRKAYSLKELKKLSSGAEIMGVDPDNLGGWEKVKTNLAKLIAVTPTLKGIVLDTTAFHYVNLDLCQKEGIKVTYIPAYSSQSVAEHTLALLFGLSKRIFATQRLMSQGKYELIKGFELADKTLGIIGLGNIGSRVAVLAKGLGMKVVAYNRSLKKIPRVEQKSLSQVLAAADYLTLHLATNQQTESFLSKKRIAQLKPGVMIVNTADRALVDEKAMAIALKNGRVDSYALEAEDFQAGPLAKSDNAFFFKGFGWYTKEALQRNKQIWVENIESLILGKAKNKVN